MANPVNYRLLFMHGDKWSRREALARQLFLQTVTPNHPYPGTVAAWAFKAADDYFTVADVEADEFKE